MDNIITTITEGDFSYIIRYSKPEDFEQVFQIWYENQKYSIKLTDDFMLEKIKTEFKVIFNTQDNNFKFWIAEFNNLIIGFQSTNRNNTNPILKNEYAESSTYVLKEFWHNKIGYELLKICLEELPYTEIKRFIGKSITTNLSMISIGKKLGFIEVGIIPETYKQPKRPETIMFVYNVPNI